jgi:hypothetical protein
MVIEFIFEVGPNRVDLTHTHKSIPYVHTSFLMIWKDRLETWQLLLLSDKY